MVHKNLSNKELLSEGYNLEEADPAGAIALYQKLLQRDPRNEAAIQRLLIVYRRQKEYRKELALLKASIGAYEQGQLAAQAAWSKANRKAARISQALAKKLGTSGGPGEGSVVTRKGAPIFEDRVVSAWRRRKEVVMKRLKQV